MQSINEEKVNANFNFNPENCINIFEEKLIIKSFE